MSHQRWNFPAMLREQGYRVTLQRMLILDAVCEGGGHTSAEEIYHRLWEKSPSINLATVYRTLDFLQKQSFVVTADLGNGRVVYEINGETPHHHLVCRNCGQIEKLDNTLIQKMYDEISEKNFFTVTTNHLVLFGLCQNCQAKIEITNPRSLYRKTHAGE